MTRLSPQAAALLRSLQQTSGGVGRLFGRRLDPAALSVLEELGELRLAPLLLPFVIEGDAVTRTRVGAMVRSLMRFIPSAAMFALDEEFRSISGYADANISDWYSLTPGHVRQLSLAPDATVLLGLASFHPDGYVRESAVAALDSRGNDESLPYLLVRLNDWVTPVAERARSAVMRRVDDGADAWVACLPLVARLRDTTRRDHAEVVDAVFALLRQPSNRAALDAGCASSDRTTRRLCYRLAWEGAGSDLASVLTRGLRNNDPIVRFEALRTASERLDDASLAPLLDVAAMDAFMPVRRETLLIGADRFPGTALHRAKRALLDPSPSIRELARYIVGKHDARFDSASAYRVLLGGVDDTSIAVALAGLGETGSASDSVLVSPFLAHARIPVRAQAVQTLGRLSADTHGDAFVRALSDASPRVAHAARDVLLRNPSLIDYQTIVATMRSAPHVHSRRDAMRLGEALGKWPGLMLWLEAAASDELALAEEARERIGRWIQRANRRSTAPSQAEIEGIQKLLRHDVSSVTPAMRDEIRSFLRPWSGETRG